MGHPQKALKDDSVSRSGIAGGKKKATILDFAGYLTDLGTGGEGERHRKINDVAKEYIKAKRDTVLVIRILTGDYKSPEALVGEFFNESEGADMPYPLYPTAVIEIVNILEGIYKVNRPAVAEIVMALMETPFFRCDMVDVFQKALKAYVHRGVKFSDAVMVHWGFWTECLMPVTEEENT